MSQRMMCEQDPAQFRLFVAGLVGMALLMIALGVLWATGNILSGPYLVIVWALVVVEAVLMMALSLRQAMHS